MTLTDCSTDQGPIPRFFPYIYLISSIALVGLKASRPEPLSPPLPPLPGSSNGTSDPPWGRGGVKKDPFPVKMVFLSPSSPLPPLNRLTRTATCSPVSAMKTSRKINPRPALLVKKENSHNKIIPVPRGKKRDGALNSHKKRRVFSKNVKFSHMRVKLCSSGKRERLLVGGGEREGETRFSVFGRERLGDGNVCV